MSRALDRPEWQAFGSCIDTDPNLFFPERGELASIAKSICASCPVRCECLEYALAEGIHFGVWGGQSERQRRGMRSRIA